jgi:hypothetical protein
MRKAISILVLITAMVLTCSIVAGTSTSITKPSIPSFTLKLIDSSYDIPTTTVTDHYTGQILTNDGSHVEARTLQITINNEPFTPFLVQVGDLNWTVDYYYNIRWKGHFEQDWHEMFLISDGYLHRDSGSQTLFASLGEYSATEGLKMNVQSMYTTFPPNAQVDFQVEAMIGYLSREVSVIPSGGWTFNGETSGWSNTQTIIIDNNSSTTDPSTSPTPSASELPPLVFLVVVFLVSAVSLVVLRRRLGSTQFFKA